MAMYDFGALDHPIHDQVTHQPRQNYDTSRIFTAVVLAGTRCSHDPVASMFGETYKALVAIDGQPMLARVVEALKNSRSVRRIVVVFDDADALQTACPDLVSAAADIPVTLTGCRATICDSVVGALEQAGAHWPYIVTTADHALLTATMVDRFCNEARKSRGLAIGLVERRHIEAHHPGSKRTYLPFRGEGYSGANLFAFMSKDAVPVINFWKRIERERKKPWKLFAAFGWRNLAGLLFKRFNIDQAFERASKMLGVQAVPVKLPFAEAAIDVDSPQDYAQVTDILERRRKTLATLRKSLDLELASRGHAVPAE